MTWNSIAGSVAVFGSLKIEKGTLMGNKDLADWETNRQRNRQNVSFPKTTRQALHHFDGVENKVTAVLHVFCNTDGPASVQMIRRMYKKLSLLVHPDRFGNVGSRCAERSMRMLARAMEQVKVEMELHACVQGKQIHATFRTSPFLLFDTEESDNKRTLAAQTKSEIRQEKNNSFRTERDDKNERPQTAKRPFPAHFYTTGKEAKR